jgi:hypothetical protein
MEYKNNYRFLVELITQNKSNTKFTGRPFEDILTNLETTEKKVLMYSLLDKIRTYQKRHNITSAQ